MHGWRIRRSGMINVTVNTNPDGFMTVTVEGHASTDICAVVSTLMQSKVRFMQELAIQYPDEIQVKINGGEQ